MNESPQCTNFNPPHSLSSYQIIKELSNGGFSKVLLARNCSGSLCALKIISKKDIQSHNLTQRIFTERDAMILLKGSPFIVSLNRCFQTGSKIVFELEYCSGGNLSTLLRKTAPLSEMTARFFVAQIVLALERIHSKDIVFRDLKPENILLTSSGHLRLSDFGVSTFKSEAQFLSSAWGTPSYLSPEVLQQKVSDTAVDFWALGVIVSYMLTGKLPFRGNSQEELFQRIRGGPPKLKADPKGTRRGSGFSQTYEGGEENDARELSDEAITLIKGLLEKEPAKRWDAKKVRGSEWFLGFDWKELESGKMETPIEILEYFQSLAGEEKYSKDWSGERKESPDVFKTEKKFSWDHLTGPPILTGPSN